MRFYIHQFVASRKSVDGDSDLSAAELIGKVTLEFMTFSGEDEGELNKEDAEEAEKDERETTDEDAWRPKGKKKMRKKVMHKLISEDPWVAGKEKLGGTITMVMAEIRIAAVCRHVL